ncbi:hypothetical protein V9T40_002867 [Parthenolecanium corni]|uniref:Uncharacterized protein n=1 Tax=Parthenolecanium corni TaxID=536013 RepID=A0AAN9TL63_9HEMI
MAADEPFVEKPKNIFKYSKSSATASNMRSVAAADMISIDKMLNYEMAEPVKEETLESADEDEISVGCPSPVGQATKSEDEDELDRKDLQRSARSPSCSSTSSTSCPPSCGYDCKTPRSDDQLEKRYSSSEDELHTSPPVKGEPEEYFKPLKRLKMMKIDKTSFSISERSKTNLNKRLNRHHHHNNHKVSDLVASPVDENEDSCQTVAGVKSFSICDILSHKPSKTAPAVTLAPVATLPPTSKIVRPWDCEPHEEAPNPYLIPPPAHRGILPQTPLFLSQFHPQQIALHLQRVKSEDLSSAYESCSSSGRSSTGGSDCCTSPDVLNCSVQSTPASVSQHASQRNRNGEQSQQQRSKSSNGKSNSSPLDALFQMTNKTFDELNGDPNAGM